MNRRQNPNSRYWKGFTLIEVMLALSLTAMLLGLLSTGVFVVADDWNRNTEVFDQTLDESLAILQIDRALHGAFPHSFTNRELLSRQIYFSGDDEFISWVTTVSPQRRPGLTAWQMYAIPDEGVYLKTVPAFSDDPTQRLDEAEATLILPGHELELSYLYEDLDESLIWTQEWEGAERLSLPLAIYVRFIPDDSQPEGSVDKEVLARVRNNIHRSIRPNLNE